MRSDWAVAYSASESEGKRGGVGGVREVNEWTPLTLPRVVERELVDGDHERDVRELGAGAGFKDLDGALDDGEAAYLLRRRESAKQWVRIQSVAPTQRT